jgi:hypothetical protein
MEVICKASTFAHAANPDRAASDEVVIPAF